MLRQAARGNIDMAEHKSVRLTVCFALRSRLLIFFVTASPSEGKASSPPSASGTAASFGSGGAGPSASFFSSASSTSCAQAPDLLAQAMLLDH